MVLDGLPGLYGLKYDSATACGLPLYLCSYKFNGSVTVGPLELTFGGSLVAPSTESRTRRSPNFGKINTVSRSSFTFGICDLYVLLELVNRLPVGA